MTRQTRRLYSSLALMVVALGTVARADDAFFQIPRSELKLTDGQWPATEPDELRWRSNLSPYAVLDHDGEVYCLTQMMTPPNRRMGVEDGELVLFVRAPKGQEVRGRLFVPGEKRAAMVPLRFVIPPESAQPESRQRFFEARFYHYEDLLNRGVPGAAWWRQRAQEAAAALGDEARQIREQLPRRPQQGIDDTFALFTGGKAVSENLQLDRALRLRPSPGEKSVDVNSIQGITVREFDWRPLIRDAKVTAEPHALLIPADQHAVFLPSFEAAARLIDEGMLLGTEALNLAEPVTEDAMTLARYQKQLCLPLTTLGRFAGPRLIDSIAVTGSDPYFRIGTDVAVLFESKDAPALRNSLAAQLGAARENDSRAKSISGNVGGIAYSGVVSPDRSICSYLATLGNSVVVTNSLSQLERLVATQSGDVPALASLPEYTFFRDRYRRGDQGESALVILSDATIRRWCGPRWRIADSRRTRAAAAISALQAANHDALVKNAAEPKLLSQNLIEGEDVRLEAHGVTSSSFGHLGFMTPISEMHVDQVTETERDAYRRWRDTYQQNWRDYFDPIAIRIGTDNEKLAMDVTVMPLIANTEYAMMLNLTRGAKLPPGAGDPHAEALAHFVLAVNRDSEMIRSASVGGERWFKVNLLDWLGDSVSVYFDRSPYWERLQKKAQENDGADVELEEELPNLPIAVRLDNRNSVKLAAFLIGVRAFADQTAPGMIAWENRRHNETPYVRLAATPEAVKEEGPGIERFALYYAALPDALTISLNEEVIKGVIDRHLARTKQPAAEHRAAPAAPAWIGGNVAAHVDRSIFEMASSFGMGNYRQLLTSESWRNLPVLNEYKRLYPDRDPVDVHQRLWGVRLVCPVGGQYVWNDQYKTMESTAVGHPGKPKNLANQTSPMLKLFRDADFGLDFEHGGLRAKAVLRRALDEQK